MSSYRVCVFLNSVMLLHRFVCLDYRCFLVLLWKAESLGASSCIMQEKSSFRCLDWGNVNGRLRAVTFSVCILTSCFAYLTNVSKKYGTNNVPIFVLQAVWHIELLFLPITLAKWTEIYKIKKLIKQSEVLLMVLL